MNNIFNTHFTASPIWDVFCDEADAIEKTSNVAMRRMVQLDRCYQILTKHFTSFKHKISNSTKTFLKTLYSCVKEDCRSITGNNLRNITLQLNVDNIESINVKAIMKMKYHKAGNPEEECRINMVEEIINVKRGKLQLENFSNTEVN